METKPKWTTATTTITAKLNNGKTVVAKPDGSAKQYRSWTAAWKACCKLDIGTQIWQSPMSRVFYVVVLS